MATLPEPTPDASATPFDRVTGRAIGLLTLLGAIPGILIVLFHRPFDVATTIGPPVVYAGVALVLVAYVLARGVDLGRLFGPAPGWRAAGVAAGLAVTILAFSFGTLIAVLAGVALANPAILESFGSHVPGFLVRSNGKVELWSTLLGAATGAFVAPLVEEFVFRGLLLTRWSRRFGVVRGLVYSALLFGVLHLSLQPLGALTLGLVAGLLYLRTRSLWTPIVAHLTNNTIVVTASTLGQHWADPARLVPGPGELRNLLFLGIALVLVAAPILAVTILRLWPRPGMTVPYDGSPAP